MRFGRQTRRRGAVAIRETVTTIFQPNLRTGATGAQPRDVARCGGASLTFRDPDVTYLSNATPVSWYSGSPDIAVVGYADNLSDFAQYERAMFRFILREATHDQSSILSGPEPEASWWPYVTGARFKWFNGVPGTPAPEIPNPDVTTSFLDIRLGRTLYAGDAPVGAGDDPFGSGGNPNEPQLTYDAAFTFGTLETPPPGLLFADWALPVNTMKTLTLSQTAIDTWLKTVDIVTQETGYLDIAFVITEDFGEPVNFKQEIAAWGANQPTLEVDFLIP